MLRALTRATHVDDIDKLDGLSLMARGESGSQPQVTRDLLYVLLFGRSGTDDAGAALHGIAAEEPEVAEEIRQLVPLLRARLHRVPNPQIRPGIPLCVHGTYSLFEISLALGYCDPSKPKVPQASVLPALSL